jgi:molybdopterin molybdotransferase
MITFDEAFTIVMNSAFETEMEIISFVDSTGRVLAERIFSDVDMPPFNRSAVDGFACHRRDLYNDLEVLEVIAAGQVPSKMPRENQCSKIMTGAIVPESCDIVFMVEDAVTLPSGNVRFQGTDPKVNISFTGEDVRKGDTVLEPGKIIRPQDVAVMASVGHTRVKVKKMPVIGVISTGDELVEPADVPGISRIRNSNAYQLLSQINRAGATGKYHGIAPDNEKSTFKLIQRAINESDIVLLTGGVSMGDFDFVPGVLKRAGVELQFEQIKVQPGKPTIFGTHSKALVFGLPGNPVSSFVQFETLVRPLINRMMGHNWSPSERELPMASRYERKSVGRMGWVPVRITENKKVIPVDYHGSAHITALPLADGLISVKEGISLIEKGAMVIVREI